MEDHTSEHDCDTSAYYYAMKRHNALATSIVQRAIEADLSGVGEHGQEPQQPAWSSSRSLSSLPTTEVRTPSITSARSASRRTPIPRVSDARLARATPSVCPDEPVLSSKYTLLPSLSTEKAPPLPDTVLYLAYGSNMAAATFEGVRGIRPLASVTVSAPTLQLTFDLPGIPYREPCFANTAVRRRVPKIPDKPPKLPPVPVPTPPGPPGGGPPGGNPPKHLLRPRYPHNSRPASHGDPVWDGGLYGVVYEVTRADFATIIATEGGGMSYQDLLVPCVALPPRMGVPERPALPEPPKAFLAHTLWAPQLGGGGGGDGDGDGDGDEKDGAGDGDGGDDGDDDDDKNWFRRHWRALRKRLLRLALTRARPDPDYAQPSPRYLQLLVDGAREHELPEDYQDWLASLQPYRVTTWRQRVGAALLLGGSLPFFLLIMLLTRRSLWPGKKRRRPDDGDDGRMPLWAMVLMGAFFRLVWWTYDTVFKPLFGDGERTMENGDEDEDEDEEKAKQATDQKGGSATYGFLPKANGSGRRHINNDEPVETTPLRKGSIEQV